MISTVLRLKENVKRSDAIQNINNNVDVQRLPVTIKIDPFNDRVVVLSAMLENEKALRRVHEICKQMVNHFE